MKPRCTLFEGRWHRSNFYATFPQTRYHEGTRCKTIGLRNYKHTKMELKQNGKPKRNYMEMQVREHGLARPIQHLSVVCIAWVYAPLPQTRYHDGSRCRTPGLQKATQNFCSFKSQPKTHLIKQAFCLYIFLSNECCFLLCKYLSSNVQKVCHLSVGIGCGVCGACVYAYIC